LIYAIGDIHGCLKALRDLMAQLPLKPGDEVVFLGDYIDRGPASKGVVEYLLQNRKPNWRFLRGNHEQMLLEWLKNPSPVTVSNWFLNGGLQTVLSYVPAKNMDEMWGERALEVLKSHIPASHMEFFNSLIMTYETQDAFFCHAGIDLDKSLGAQQPDDLLWIRRKFIEDPRPTPKLVIYGHTPIELVELKGDRINIDTGCVYGRVLTALALPEKKLYQTAQ
jgi:serine/threonine protein phosphatase 1